MNQLNSLILEGNVVTDCVVTEPKPDFLVGKFTMEVDRFYKNKDNEMTKESSYFEIECYGNMAKLLSSKITKGRGIRLVGKLKSEHITTLENKKYSRVFVVAEHIEFKLKKETIEQIEAECTNPNE